MWRTTGNGREPGAPAAAWLRGRRALHHAPCALSGPRHDRHDPAPRLADDAGPLCRHSPQRLLPRGDVAPGSVRTDAWRHGAQSLSLIHISEPTRLGMISYAVF